MPLPDEQLTHPTRVAHALRAHFDWQKVRTYRIHVCAPDGTVIARAAQGRDEILYADADLASTARSHARQLFLKHRRPELYGGWLSRSS